MILMTMRMIMGTDGGKDDNVGHEWDILSRLSLPPSPWLPFFLPSSPNSKAFVWPFSMVWEEYPDSSPSCSVITPFFPFLFNDTDDNNRMAPRGDGDNRIAPRGVS